MATVMDIEVEFTEDIEIFWITQGSDAFKKGFNFGKCICIPPGNYRRAWIKGYNIASDEQYEKGKNETNKT